MTIINLSAGEDADWVSVEASCLRPHPGRTQTTSSGSSRRLRRTRRSGRGENQTGDTSSGRRENLSDEPEELGNARRRPETATSNTWPSSCAAGSR